MAVTCPTLEHILNSEQCTENFAGTGSVIYVGLKEDLETPMALPDGDNTYPTPTFKAGKGLYKIECKEEQNKIDGASLGRRKGFKLTGTFVLEAVNQVIAKTGRALNNLDLFFIVPDGDAYQIMYDPIRKVVFDSDGITTTTGAAASDDRITTLTATLQPVKYPNLFVTIDDIESLLEGAVVGS